MYNYQENKNKHSFTFLKKSFDETVELLNLTHYYYKNSGENYKNNLPDSDKITYTIIMTEIIAQLSSVLSWLLTWKAVDDGDINTDEAYLELNRLNQVQSKVANINCPEYVSQVMSKPLQYLHDKSSNLYQRIRRLDAKIA